MRLRSTVFSKLATAALAAVLATGGVTLFPANSRAQSDGNSSAQDFRDSELIVEIRSGASIDSVNQRNRTTTIEQLNGTNFYRLSVPSKKNLKKWEKVLEAD